MGNKFRWSPSEIGFLENNYSSKGWDHLAKRLPARSKESISAKAKRSHLTKRWTTADMNLLKKIYPMCSSEEIIKSFPRKTLLSIRLKVCRLGIKRKNHFNYVNVRFFRRWSQQMAYVLGFIAADGCVSIEEKDDRHQLIIQINDLEILEKIRRELGSTHPIQKVVRRWGPIYRLSICSKRLVVSLLELGIKPRKSLSIEFPDVPRNYVRHFIRGVLDGDGSIGITKFSDGKKYLKLTLISGSRSFVQSLNYIIGDYLGMEQKNIAYDNGVYVLGYTHKTAKIVLNWIYAGSTIYLARKHQRFLEYLRVVQ